MSQIPLTITSYQRKFTDLDFAFVVNPGTGDVAKRVNDEAIKQSLKNLILTKKYERPFQPNLSSQIYDLLFENFTINIQATLERIISTLIETYEPRVQLINVNVYPIQEQHSLEITLEYTVVGIAIPTTFTFTLERTR